VRESLRFVEMEDAIEQTALRTFRWHEAPCFHRASVGQPAPRCSLRFSDAGLDPVTSQTIITLICAYVTHKE